MHGCWVDTVCRPTELGGLGVPDLKQSGYAMKTHWLWLQRTDQERAWAELPLHVDPVVQQFFRSFFVLETAKGTILDQLLARRAIHS
jgi:hypothetical protein